MSVPRMRNPAIDKLVPGLLLIKAVAVVHDRMRQEIAKRGLTESRKSRSTFEDTINLLAQDGLFGAIKADLHRIRDRRDRLTHELGREFTGRRWTWTSRLWI